MELRQLRYFVAVVEEANFTRAAARLHLAQPGLSAQIRQLERELGQPLLDRSGRSVTPTEVGEAVLPYARAALAAAEGVRQTVDAFTGLLRGQVTIGLVSGAAAHEFDVASVLAEFHDDHPQVDIALTEDTSERMLAALRRGELDIAILGLVDEHPPPGTSAQIVVDQPLVAAVAPDDPLLFADFSVTTESAVAESVSAALSATAPENAQAPGKAHAPGNALAPECADAPESGAVPKTVAAALGSVSVTETAVATDGAIPLAALRDRPLISLPRGTGLRGVLERACTEAGFRPRIAFEAAAPSLLTQLAARGLGVAIVPALEPGTAAALGLRTLRITEPGPRGRIALTWRTDGPASPAARALLGLLRRALAPRGPWRR
ncbi:LysR family transcriptional regulator [Streptomyces sp. LX-29]|uniref:LysR family transcriptional regulator n=1 Tax=Streptomyces sp. LX-29 TaxID=2900152 RepID=UPI00240D218B|nr:LysR family transcriptional regulator [Streptomyces sp. LX-29]WFB06023.1 LysR family transcriptional regulator [Streptomyces sp. LX-29]